MTKLAVIPNTLVASANSSFSEVELEQLAQVMGSLHRSDRVETLCYAFVVALDSGVQKRGPFNVDAALAALTGGYIKLHGSAQQIKAQRLLLQGSVALLKRVCESTNLSLHLSAQERIATLVYAFNTAYIAGHQDNGFYADRAIQSLRTGELSADGNLDQIEAKQTLIEAAAAMIERATQHEPPFYRPPQAMGYLLKSRQPGRELTREEKRKELGKLAGVFVNGKLNPAYE